MDSVTTEELQLRRELSELLSHAVIKAVREDRRKRGKKSESERKRKLCNSAISSVAEGLDHTADSRLSVSTVVY